MPDVVAVPTSLIFANWCVPAPSTTSLSFVQLLVDGARERGRPRSRIFLGNVGVSATRDLPVPAPLPPAHRVCDKCQGGADLLESLSTFARVDYYRCTKCSHVWIQNIDPNEPRADVTIKIDEEAS